MTDKEFDDILKHKLDQFDEAYDPESWERLEKRIEDEGLSEDSDFDESIRAALAGFAGIESSPDWERMEQQLSNEEELAFDNEVKDKVGKYAAPYDPSSWPILNDKITEDERLRRKLIGAKVLEVAAVLIAMLTLFNFLPLLEKAMSEDRQLAAVAEESAESYSATNTEDIFDERFVASPGNKEATVPQGNQNITSDESTTGAFGAQPAVVTESGSSNGQAAFAPSGGARSTTSVPSIGSQKSVVVHDMLGPAADWHEVEPMIRNSMMTERTATLGLPENIGGDIGMKLPATALPSRGKSLRLGISTSLDVNRLHMPSDQFNADGKKIKFCEKDLIATGYSIGATIIFDRKRWSFETGLLYSLKSFEPNRVLQIGKTFDVRTLDFEEISIHVISIPLNAIWNFDRKGKTRFYAVGGLGFNIIASANYDLLTRGSVGSQPPGGTRTDFEVRRVREHVLDGAEFSSKAFLTASAGMGVEHHFNKKLSLFAQPTYSYQVPFFVLSDKAGKHIQYLSMQVGTRVRLR